MSKPFSQCSYNAAPTSDAARRLRSALLTVNALELDNRMSIMFDRLWGKECIARFDPEEPDCLVIQIFPGNSKGQGYYMHQLNPDWLNRDTVVVDGSVYQVVIAYHTKFSHIKGKYISSVGFPISETAQKLLEPINTAENQVEIAGRWHREQWPKLIEILSGYFKFDWQSECDFAVNFTNTGRNQLNLALGYSVNMLVPYQVLQGIDINQNDDIAVGQFILRCMEALISFVEN